jgi:aldehyde:ferredoxin oxidoreductase
LPYWVKISIMRMSRVANNRPRRKNMAGGFMGKMLWVDLSKQELKDEVLDEELGRQFLGGYGLGARMLFSRQKAGVDPLGPDNTLGFMTGPIVGTPAIGGSRYTLVGKSPLTGGWGDANSGGYFGPHLKFAGYDAVFFTGVSEKPAYLFIDNGKAELRDAAHLWGKDTFDTEDILRSELGEDVEAACIGPAGEKVSLIACVMNNKGRAAGRSGLGAVMGSKKLKAIAVKGNMKVPLANEQLSRELRKKYLAELGGPIELLREFGTPGVTLFCAERDDLPTKNWSGVAMIDFPELKLLGGSEVIALQEKKYACYRCPIGCGGHMKEGTGEYKYGTDAHKPEYETIAMFGINCLNSNLESIIKLNDMCNRGGIDTISTGSAIGFTIELYEKGILTQADTDGIEMTWGSHRSIVAMTEKVIKREGFGAVLADGVKAAAERIGKGAEEYAIHIEGQEVPAHDPRAGLQWAYTYWLDATPARHTQGAEGPMPEGVMPKFDFMSLEGRGEPHKVGVTFSHFLSSAGMCNMVIGGMPHANAFIESVKAVTGWDLTREEVDRTGERIANIRQAFNSREGLNLLKFKIPNRIMGNPPKKRGSLAGVTLDKDLINREFFTAMDWDLETAKPSKEKLLEMGLKDVAQVLWP